MSVEAMAIALHHSRATGTAKLILIGIANHDGDGGAWPSMTTLARYGGVSMRNARNAVATLERLGEVRRGLQEGGLASTPPAERPNLYHFLLRCPAGCDRTRNHRVRPVDKSPSDPRSVATPPVGSDRGTPVGSDRLTTHLTDLDTSPAQRHPVGDAEPVDSARCNWDKHGATARHFPPPGADVHVGFTCTVCALGVAPVPTLDSIRKQLTND